MANKINEKIEEASTEIAQNPNDATPYKRRGDLHTSKGEHGLAYKDYHDASELKPGDVKIAKKRLDALDNHLKGQS